MTPQAFVPEPELSGPVPRPARFTRGTQVARFLLLALLVAGVWLVCGLASRDLADLAALRTSGRQVTASVMGKHETHGKSTSYYLDYGFLGNWTWVSDDESVSRSEYNAASLGDPILVTYLPSHPKTHRVGQVDEARVARARTAWTWGGGVTFVVLGLILLVAEANYRNQRRLLREGIPVTSEVMDRKSVPGKSTTYYIWYRYPLPNGGEETKKLSVSSRVYDQCPPGRAVTVLYDPNRPANSRPYRAITAATLR